MKTQALEDLFVEELEELYDAEKQIYKGLSVLAKKATDPELTAAFEAHQKQTKTQVHRLEKCFKILGVSAERGKATGVTGLIKQSGELGSRGVFDPAVTDAALLASAQKIEHYEIAAYGCVRTHAGILGYKEVEDLVTESLHEEEETDALLTKIAQSTVNMHAAAAPYAQARTGYRHDVTVPSSERSSDGGLSLGKLALGLAIGGALSVLFAPKSGQDTRNQIRDSFRDMTRDLTKKPEPLVTL
jgi:ferritin-like metal-binding protein YciE